MNISRRSFLGLTPFLGAGMIIPASARAEQVSGEPNLFTQTMAQSFAKRFADSVSGCDSLIPSAPVALRNTSGASIGCIVDFTDVNGIDYGYVILDNNFDSLISEYSFERNSVSPYKYLVDRSMEASTRNSLSPRPLAVKTGPLMYGIVYEDGTCMDLEGRETTLANLSSRARASIEVPWDDFYAGDAGDGQYNIITSANLDQFASFSQIDTMLYGWRYACAVVAMLNAALLYLGPLGAFDFTAISAYYDHLWAVSKTSTDGGTARENIAPGMQKFLADHFLEVSYTEGINPSFTDYMETIYSENVAFFAAWPEGQDPHIVTVEGFAVLQSISNPYNMVNALVIADGWVSQARYLNISSEGMGETYGIHFRQQ